MDASRRLLGYVTTESQELIVVDPTALAHDFTRARRNAAAAVANGWRSCLRAGRLAYGLRADGCDHEAVIAVSERPTAVRVPVYEELDPSGAAYRIVIEINEAQAIKLARED